MNADVCIFTAISAFLEHAAEVTEVTAVTEMVSRMLARSPPSTHAGGQDDGSYTNSLKLHDIRVYSATFQDRPCLHDIACDSTIFLDIP